jgi:hypothetical protein
MRTPELNPMEISGGLRFGKAVEAAKIAAVGDAYAQIAQDAAVRINQLLNVLLRHVAFPQSARPFQRSGFNDYWSGPALQF